MIRATVIFFFVSMFASVAYAQENQCAAVLHGATVEIGRNEEACKQVIGPLSKVQRDTFLVASTFLRELPTWAFSSQSPVFLIK